MNEEQPTNAEAQSSENQASDSNTSWNSLTKIKFDPDHAAQLQLSEAGDNFGPGRQDKNVTIKAGGQEKRSSSIMLGKNEAGYNLDDSTYISAADVEQTITDALADNEGDAQLVDIRQQPPRPVSPAEAVSEISSDIGQEHSSITISKNENITNQDARNAEVSLPGTEERNLKGVLMLGNENIEFADGEYLSQAATIKALEDYMIATPEATSEADELPAETVVYISPEAQGVTKSAISERAKKIKRAVATTAATLIMMASIIGTSGDAQAENSKFDPHINNEVTSSQTIEDIAQEEANKNEITTPTTDRTVEDTTKSIRKTEEARKFQGVDIGDIYEIPDGVKVHESSDYQYDGANNIGTIGSEALPDQDYTIQGFSILDPDTHEVVTDNVTWEEGTNLGEYLEKVSKRTGVPVEKLEQGTKIHVGHGESSAGWVDYEDIIDKAVDADNHLTGGEEETFSQNNIVFYDGGENHE
ncbi:hypothetical protein IJI91_02680 [Candidatus Saccharibacteria bacterium]|nr:hypothetical protein [Candidatus Saccharibacteria bacterium]